MGTQLRRSYKNVVKQQCELKRQIILNALSSATHSPDEFALRYMKGPGYVGLTSAETITLIKCMPVEVQIDTKIVCS